jgi:hypothetical protein
MAKLTPEKERAKREAKYRKEALELKGEGSQIHSRWFSNRAKEPGGRSEVAIRVANMMLYRLNDPRRIDKSSVGNVDQAMVEEFFKRMKAKWRTKEGLMAEAIHGALIVIEGGEPDKNDHTLGVFLYAPIWMLEGIELAASSNARSPRKKSPKVSGKDAEIEREFKAYALRKGSQHGVVKHLSAKFNVVRETMSKKLRLLGIRD